MPKAMILMAGKALSSAGMEVLVNDFPDLAASRG